MNSLQPIPFAVSSSQGVSRKSNNSEMLNMFAHTEETGSKSDFILLGTEGLETITAITGINERILGIYEFHDIVYIATTRKFYKVVKNSTTYDTLIEVGDVNFQDKVIFADNGIELMLVCKNGYAYNPTTEVLKDMSTEEGWYPADTVAYMDGYFIFNRSETGQFFISKLYSSELDPIDWATGESAPDDTVGVFVANRQLWLFGERTSEVWYDSGDVDFPFTRISGAVNDIGAVSHKVLAEIHGSIFFIGSDFRVYSTQGYTPILVSTPSVEIRIKNTNVEELRGFSYTNGGHWFYVLNIDNNLTLVYDINSKLWHRRESCGTKGDWLIDGAINLRRNNNPVGFSGSNFYDISFDHLTEDGENIKRESISMPINKSVNRFVLAECQLDMETCGDEEVEVCLELSNDSGMTWSNKNVSRTGKVGEFRNRVRWLRLGQFRDCIVKITITDPILIRILGFYARSGR